MPFLPSDLSGLILDIESKRLTGLSNSNPVATFTDFSGTNNHATQSTAAKRPTYLTNQTPTGAPCVSFDGVDDWMDLTTELTTGRSFFFVVKWRNPFVDNVGPILGHPTVFHWSGGYSTDTTGSSLGKILNKDASSTNIRNGTAKVNGVDAVPADVDRPSTYKVLEFHTIAAVTFRYLTNDRNLSGRIANYDLCAVVVYNRVLTDPEKTQVRGYLDSEYVTVTIPTAPSGATATAISATRVDILWTDNSNNETGFKIQRKVGSGAFADLTTVGVGVTSYSDTTAVAATPYTYRVMATNSAGDSAGADTNQVTTPLGPTPPAKPTSLIATPQGPNVVSLNWQDNS